MFGTNIKGIVTRNIKALLSPLVQNLFWTDVRTDRRTDMVTPIYPRKQKLNYEFVFPYQFCPFSTEHILLRLIRTFSCINNILSLIFNICFCRCPFNIKHNFLKYVKERCLIYHVYAVTFNLWACFSKMRLCIMTQRMKAGIWIMINYRHRKIYRQKKHCKNKVCHTTES